MLPLSRCLLRQRNAPLRQDHRRINKRYPVPIDLERLAMRQHQRQLRAPQDQRAPPPARTDARPPATSCSLQSPCAEAGLDTPRSVDGVHDHRLVIDTWREDLEPVPGAPPGDRPGSAPYRKSPAGQSPCPNHRCARSTPPSHSTYSRWAPSGAPGSARRRHGQCCRESQWHWRQHFRDVCRRHTSPSSGSVSSRSRLAVRSGILRVLLDHHLDVVLVLSRRGIGHHLGHEVHRGGWLNAAHDAQLGKVGAWAAGPALRSRRRSH